MGSLDIKKKKNLRNNIIFRRPMYDANVNNYHFNKIYGEILAKKVIVKIWIYACTKIILFTLFFNNIHY